MQGHVHHHASVSRFWCYQQIPGVYISYFGCCLENYSLLDTDLVHLAWIVDMIACSTARLFDKSVSCY